MRGIPRIINSQADAKTVNLSNEKLIEMATITVRHDGAVYPENYDTSLSEGDSGYIEPIWTFTEEVDQAVLDRLGSNS